MCEQKYNYLSSQTSHQTLHLFAWPTINLILNSQPQPTNCPVLVVSLHLGWDYCRKFLHQVNLISLLNHWTWAASKAGNSANLSPSQWFMQLTRYYYKLYNYLWCTLMNESHATLSLSTKRALKEARSGRGLRSSCGHSNKLEPNRSFTWRFCIGPWTSMDHLNRNLKFTSVCHILPYLTIIQSLGKYSFFPVLSYICWRNHDPAKSFWPMDVPCKLRPVVRRNLPDPPNPRALCIWPLVAILNLWISKIPKISKDWGMSRMDISILFLWVNAS